jgi:acetyl-CoA acetyltransferase
VTGGSAAVLTGVGQTPAVRHPRPEDTTARLLARAVRQALEDAGLRPADVDGLAVASFTLVPDHAIDLAWRLGLRLRWIMDDAGGGVSGLSMLQHARRAVEAGDATTVVVCAGDRMDGDALRALNAQYNAATRDELAALPHGGPNTLFAMLTQRHAASRDLRPEDYATVAVRQRAWAAGNPRAAYRSPLTLQEYLDAPVVAPPLRRFDCVPNVAGADALVVQAPDARPAPGRSARIAALAAVHNPDDQQGDGLTAGFAEVARVLWEAAGCGPGEVDAAFVYDDYPAMALVQAEGLGLDGGDLHRFIRHELGRRHWALNTSGGMLSAGQAGAAGGTHGLVEAVRQLRGRAGDRQVDARRVLVSGYGMTLYRHGACHAAAVLEGTR